MDTPLAAPPRRMECLHKRAEPELYIENEWLVSSAYTHSKLGTYMRVRQLHAFIRNTR